MCTKTIKVLEAKQADVLAAYSNGDDKTRAALEAIYGREPFNQKITDLVKTFEDALAITGEDWCPPQGMTSDEIAYRKLKIIAKALNQGWTPDWTDSNQIKYTVWLKDFRPGGVGFDDSGYGSWFTVTGCGSRLCYRSKELALYAGKQFEDLYKEFFLIAG
ncbi:MAG: hypothetical protein F9K23_00840 [Bacteroidetes bacterium]|nr:MAG: hypothetical protein F9K23_00840 [Bacteroidota bacterium]